MTVKEHIRRLKAYTPGIQPEKGEKVVKLNTNENPYPPSGWIQEAIWEESIDDNPDSLRLYPDPECQQLRNVAAYLYDLSPNQILCGNGSDEILGILLRTFTAPGDRIGYYEPSYSYYATLGAIHDLNILPTPLGKNPLNPPLPSEEDLQLFFLTNPNSPLGFSLPVDFVEKLARHIKGILVVDEAYADFARWNCLSLVNKYDNVIVTRTLSKSYSLAGMRIGFGFGPEKWIGQMNKVRDHYNLNRIAQVAAYIALLDQNAFQENTSRILQTREKFHKSLTEMGLATYPTEANFIFVTFDSAEKASGIYHSLEEKKILVRYFPQKGLDHGLRISIGTDDEMNRLLEELRTLL